MRTDYKNINGFEALAVIFAVVGVCLTAVMIFVSLPDRQQREVAGAFDILDIKQEAGQTMQSLELVYNVHAEFLNQFYIAFVQVASISPDEFQSAEKILHQAQKSIGEYADIIGPSFVASNSPEVQITTAGKVAGAIVDLSNRLKYSKKAEPDPKPPQLFVPYGFESMNLKPLGQQIMEILQK